MREVPGYPKVFTLGSVGTERALLGPVVVQEKVDGSQFGFGKDEDGRLVMRSHHQQVHAEDYPGMFKGAVEHVLSLDLSWVLPDTYFYCEVLCKPKHNTIAYDRVPVNHIMLFDVARGGWVEDRFDMKLAAERLRIELVPELYHGEVSVDALRNLLQFPSVLGGSPVEGVVVKNYHETVAPGGRMQSLFVKLVNEEFKERNKGEFKSKTVRGTVEDYIASFRSEARWMKAVQHLREQDLLVGEPKDIGILIKEIDRDVVEEEQANIKEELYHLVKSEVLRTARSGFPEWYKEKLIEWNILKEK